MRKVTEAMVHAFRNGLEWKSGNTRVYKAGDTWIASLHNNPIAYRIGKCETLTFSGWYTTTTRDRLQALAPGHVRIRKGEGQFLIGGEWVCEDYFFHTV